jgi:hypothetical protein
MFLVILYSVEKTIKNRGQNRPFLGVQKGVKKGVKKGSKRVKMTLLRGVQKGPF